MARKRKGGRAARATKRLFKDPSKQLNFLETSYEEDLAAERNKPVECLGMTFDDDETRREHFLAELREGVEELHAKLGGVPFATVEDAVERMKSIENWPMGDDDRLRELAERMRQAESSKDLLQRWKAEVGFPHGEIQDILVLSDPPYYTACPNPFLAAFVEEYGRLYDPDEAYHREPFAVDVSEGKTDQLYKAHGYHTKVPHLAIAPSILHYTRPGDIVLDGFCGSGMTGVAAQFCGMATPEHRCKVEEHYVKEGQDRPEWGARRVILGDLAPCATFIAANYNIPLNVGAFVEEARRLLDDVEEETGWMYETHHTGSKSKGRINYTVWSEVFSCHECAGEIVFAHEALDDTKRVKKEFPCPQCGVILRKNRLRRAFETLVDSSSGKPWKRFRLQPVLINYTVGGSVFEKEPDAHDLSILGRAAELGLPAHVPTNPFPFDDMWEAPRLKQRGITHVHQMFLPRAAHALAAMWRRALAEPHQRRRLMLLFSVEQAIWGMSLLARYTPTHYSQVNQYLTGVYYIGSQIVDVSPWYILDGKLDRLRRAFTPLPSQPNAAVMTTGDCARLPIPRSSVDYVFTDPPFGDNFPYWELNYLVESWYRVLTRGDLDAIVDRSKQNKRKQKDVRDYQRRMAACFAEYYRVLKPGRWMTVVFSNSKNVVWWALQEAMSQAGFVIADVRTLDKKQGSFKQVTSIAIRQDLVISAYKPNHGLEERFKLEAGSEEGVWDFVRTHLSQLPVFVSKDGKAEVVAERQNYLLFDRMVAFHVQRGVTVPLSAAEFYAGVEQRFPFREGMYFLSEQIPEHDKKRMTVKEVLQLELFVVDEASAVQWLKQQLTRRPQTFQELHPQFLKEIAGWQKHERPLELSEMLEQNFLSYDGTGEVPSQIHSYLSTNFKELRKLAKDDAGLKAKGRDRWYVPDPNKAGDLEKLRDRSLLKEFEEYKQRTKKFKRGEKFRMEAVRAGFKKAWQDRDYQTIIDIAQKIPENVLQEDPKLLMWYDQAVTRSGREG